MQLLAKCIIDRFLLYPSTSKNDEYFQFEFLCVLGAANYHLRRNFWKDFGRVEGFEYCRLCPNNDAFSARVELLSTINVE